MDKSKLPTMAVHSKRSGVWSRVAPKSFDRWSPGVAAMDSEDSASISILDVIGQDFWGDGVTAKRIAGALRNIGDKPVTVNVNSPGGDFFEGLAIYNLLRAHSQPVTVNVVGIAASAASVIAMAGDEIRMARAGFMMIHNTWVMAAGDQHELREVADWLGPFDAAATDLYASRTGIDRDEITAMLNKETWIGGNDAVEQGFADALMPADEIDVRVDASASDEVRAERKLSQLFAMMGVPRSEGRSLVRDLKGGTPSATASDKQNAVVVEGLKALISAN